MVQPVSPRPLSMKARVWPRASPFEICGRQSGNGSAYFRLPLSVPSNQHSSLIFINILLLPEKQMGEARKYSDKQYSIGYLAALDRQLLPRFSYLTEQIRPTCPTVRPK